MGNKTLKNHQIWWQDHRRSASPARGRGACQGCRQERCWSHSQGGRWTRAKTLPLRSSCCTCITQHLPFAIAPMPNTTPKNFKPKGSTHTCIWCSIDMQRSGRPKSYSCRTRNTGPQPRHRWPSLPNSDWQTRPGVQEEYLLLGSDCKGLLNWVFIKITFSISNEQLFQLNIYSPAVEVI